MDVMGYQYGAVPTQRNDPQYIAYLEQRIAALESRLPNTKVVAQGFFARSFAIWGHHFVAQFLIGLALSVIMTLISLIFAGSLAAVFGTLLENVQSTGY